MDLKTILVPVDGSDPSLRATTYALEMAARFGANILLVHCHRPFPDVLGEPFYQQAVNKILKKCDELVEPYRGLIAASGTIYTERILEGPPREAILTVARVEECDLIVIGSRGLSNVKGIILGSVTHRILHGAPCPVLVVQ
jgi:nucleotide-binding universal stress UspA family protein